MKEKKMFFRGLRRGDKQKEGINAVHPEEKTIPIDPFRDETVSITGTEENVFDAKNTPPNPDEIPGNTIILDCTRPNETLGDLLADIRKMNEQKDVHNETAEQSAIQESAPLSSHSETKEKKSTLGEIIAGIKSKSEQKQDLNEPDPEEKSTPSAVSPEDLQEDRTEEKGQETIPEGDDERPDNAPVTQDTEEIISENTGDTIPAFSEDKCDSTTINQVTETVIPPIHGISKVTEFEDNATDFRSITDSEAGQESGSHLSSLIQTIQNEPPRNSSDKIPDSAADAKSGHLSSLIQTIQNEPAKNSSDEIPDSAADAKSGHPDSLIADVQRDRDESVKEDQGRTSENETENKIDRIITELLNNDDEIPDADCFSDTPEKNRTGSLDSIIQEIQKSKTSVHEIPFQQHPDDIINELVDAFDEATLHESTKPQISTTRITRIIEEVSIEGNTKIRNEDITIKPNPSDAQSVPPAKEKRHKNGINSAGEVPSYSDLILSGGAELDLEDFHLSDRSYNFEMDNRKEILAALDEIAEGDLDKLNLSKLKPAEILPEKAAEQEGKKKKIGQGLFGKIMSKVVEYDPAIHGALVDIPHSSGEGIEEIELYPVNEPYAYIRIIFDHNTHEYLYTVIEPELSEGEHLLLQELTQRLFETLDISTKDLTKERACAILTEAVDNIIFDYGIKFDPVSREKILYHIHKNFIGDGRIDAIMHDKYIEDISCDGINAPIFVFHSNYESIQTNLVYTRADDLDSFVTKLAQRAGKYISIAEPMLDATMADGSRIQMTLGYEVTAHGSTFTIRKFKDEPITPTDLIEWGTYSPLSVAFLWIAVENGKSCIFAGGTASGKTTSLNAISLFIPPLAKIVTLEDTRELKLPHKNWIPSITRESFDSDGKGSIDMYELLRAALRQRPEYILVGEVRGKEAQTLFQAMSTGHVTYATTHADSVASVVHRFENPPMNVPRNMLSALDLVSIQVQARFGGQRIRRNKTLIEILDIDPRTNELITNEVFKWNAATDEIRFSGKSYILEDIMEGKGWTDTRMREELKRRQEILEWMRLKKIRHFQEVAKVLLSYYRNPETVMELVRGDLYE
jgi:flagellar protein FlaI